MREKVLNSKKTIWLIILTALVNCTKSNDLEPVADSCEEEVVTNTSMAELKSLYSGTTIQIQEDLVIEGYVISSDRAGNFFGTLHFQDSPVLPVEGLQIDLDQRDIHLFFEPGAKIIIKLKGLYLGKSKGVYKLGGVLNAFGNETVGRLPANVVQEHISLACEETESLKPTAVEIENLDDRRINTLIQIANVEFTEEELGLTYATTEEQTVRVLSDCEGNTLQLLNSGYSNFRQEKLPQRNGNITGVLYKENKAYQLIIRDTTDLVFAKERCAEGVNEISSSRIFISELADPDNNNKARFVELFNASDEPINLEGWELRRYTNSNQEIGSSIDLSGNTISGKDALVISPNSAEFKAVYGFEADLEVGSNSAADSNGDDNLELVDPFGNVVDIFGVIGEDGSGTNHEFEDGRAIRNPEISKGNPVFTFAEWTIYNDSGEAGTINQPQNAPEDFSPGQHN